MPEGDTVWRTAQRLHQTLTGQPVRVEFRVPRYATAQLQAEVVQTLSRGKHLLTRFATGVTLHTHLKMEGSWHLYRPGAPWQRPTHEARVILHGPRHLAVGFALGIVEMINTAAEDTTVGHLGPDLLGPDWSATAAVERLAQQPDRALHAALLDQRNLAGIGNMYAAELCFIFGRHPAAPVHTMLIGKVSALAIGPGETDTSAPLYRLVTRAQQLLAQNKQRSLQTTTGIVRRGQQHWVYRRAGQPCRRCGNKINSAALTDAAQLTERVTFWCPHCQPVPSKTESR